MVGRRDGEKKEERKMKMPLCTVCQMVYNEGERAPMMLHCGHSFCKECLAHMFEAGPISGAAGGTHALICPRCRQSTEVGNSVEALRKNFALLSLLCIKEGVARGSGGGAEEEDDDDEEEEEDEEEREEEEEDGDEEGGGISSSGCVGGGGMLDLGSHSIRLVKLLGSGPRHGQELWDGVLMGPAGCKHKAAVKRLSIPEGMDVEWVQRRVESLRRASTWCQNACSLYGACQKEGKLCIVSRKYPASVLSEMQQNEGRLSFEQILRYGADIARGVAELHAAGVVCMNLKPSNLLLDARGRAAVSDFGLPEILKKPRCRKARPLTTNTNTTAATTSTSSAEDGSSLRLHSCMECTMLNPHYTAPEAWEPLKKSSLNIFWEDGTGMSAESDAWSFGCTLVEMCTGAVPWAGLSTEEIYKAVKARRQPPQYVGVVGAGIPRELWKMIGECLQFKPSKRPTFHAMLSTFLRHLQEMPLSPPQSPDNDPSKDSETTGIEPSPSSVLEFLQESQNVLHRLVSEYNIEGVRDLLAKASENSVGALLDSRNAEGQTALHLAAMRGYSEIVKVILEHPEADVDALDKDGDTPIVFAFASGNPDCLELLIRRGADVNARLKEGLGPSVAHMCCFYGDPECMKVLLSAGADPNVADSEGETVLHRAIEKKRTECAIVILENGGCKSMSSLNSKGLTPLHLCIAMANVSVVERWVAVATPEEIKATIDIQGPSGSALCMAAAHKKAHETESRELVQILLAAGANPCITDKLSGHTPLHAAAIANDVEMVKLMLDSGIDVDVRDIRNTTALHVSLARGSKACVGLLLERGANCNLQDDEGDNAFHIAADMAKMVRENLEWIVLMLNIENTAIDARNHNGRTLKDFVEALPREWISEDLMEALAEKGIHLTPTVFEPADWVKYKRTVKVPKYGWQGANPNCVGFVQSLPDESHLIISICTGEARILKEEVIKVIPLDRGQHVQLRKNVKEPKYGWRGQSRDSIGTVLCVDDDGILRVGFPGASRGWKADPAEMERVEEFQVRDWVRIRPSLTSVKHGLGSVTPGSIGVVYSIRPDNSLLLDINYLQGPWRCEPEEVERVEPFKVGDRVCVRRSVAEPQYAWGGETHHSVGRISEIGSDALLIIDIAERPLPWQADPSDMEKVEDFKVGDWVRVKASVSSPKYGWDDVTRRCVGIVHSLDEEGDLGVGFCFRSKPFACSITDMEKMAPYEVGQEIHIISSVTEPRLGWLGETSATTGKIARIDMDGTLNVRVAGRSTLWKVSPGDAECLSGFEVGDWVKLKSNGGVKPSYDWHGISKESSAVVHSVSDNGYLELACCFRSGRWMAHYSEVEKVLSFKVGQHVQFRSGLSSEPRWGWRGCSPNSKGVIVGVHADGELRVAFPGLPAPWRADPADLECEDTFEVGDWVRVEVENEDTNLPVASESKVGRRKPVRLGSIGIVQGVVYEEQQGVLVGFCGEPGRWLGLPQELRKVEAFQVGQRVRVKEAVKQPRFGWSGQDHSSLGTVIAIDADARLRVHPLGGGNNKAWMLDPAEVEVVTEKPTCIGDWVRVRASVRTPAHQWGPVSHQSVGVVHKISDSEDGDLCVAFCFLERLWLCKPAEMERVEPFSIGDKVRIKRSVVTPRWGWGIESYASRGQVIGVDADGKLRIRFRWREGRPWIGDPADIELDSSN